MTSNDDFSCRPVPDLVSTADFACAIAGLILLRAHVEVYDEPTTALSVAIINRIRARLEEKLEAHLFGPSLRVQSEAHAQAMLKGLALHLSNASAELFVAAEAMRQSGVTALVGSAQRSFKAHLRAKHECAPYLE